MLYITTAVSGSSAVSSYVWLHLIGTIVLYKSTTASELLWQCVPLMELAVELQFSVPCLHECIPSANAHKVLSILQFVLLFCSCLKLLDL